MKASESLQNDQSTATENALRRTVDTTPAFIQTARPDGYIDYFNREWLDFLGKSLEDVCGWRWTGTVHPEDVTATVQKSPLIQIAGKFIERKKGRRTPARAASFAQSPWGSAPRERSTAVLIPQPT